MVEVNMWWQLTDCNYSAVPRDTVDELNIQVITAAIMMVTPGTTEKLHQL